VLNKLMMVPYTIYIILSVLTLMSGVSYVDAQMDYTNVSSEGNSVMGINNTVSSGSATFSLFTTSFLLFVGALVGICIIAGLQIFSSGLSETAQGLMFKSLLYFGVYFALVAAATPWLFAEGSGEIGLLIFFVLTIMFVLGFVEENKAGA